MRYHNAEHVFYHDWETVTAAFWEKYPNHFQPHVKRVDTVYQQVHAETQCLHICRLMSLRYSIPSWIKALIRTSADGYGVERAKCDLKRKVLALDSENITFSNIFKVREVCEYRVHPENPNWTLYTQKASYSVFGFGMATSTLEKIALQMAQDKAKKGLKAMSGKIASLAEANWKQNYDMIKERASKLCSTYASASNHFLLVKGQFLRNEVAVALQRFTVAKQRVLKCQENWKSLMKDANICLSKVEQAKGLYADALKSMEVAFQEVYDETRKMFDCRWMDGQRRYFSLLSIKVEDMDIIKHLIAIFESSREKTSCSEENNNHERNMLPLRVCELSRSFRRFAQLCCSSVSTSDALSEEARSPSEYSSVTSRLLPSSLFVTARCYRLDRTSSNRLNISSHLTGQCPYSSGSPHPVDDFVPHHAIGNSACSYLFFRKPMLLPNTCVSLFKEFIGSIALFCNKVYIPAGNRPLLLSSLVSPKIKLQHNDERGP